MMYSPIARLALGTVQFGMPYGVSNARGQVPEGKVRTILANAAASGIDLLDTAAAYGTAEIIVSRVTADLGHPFRIVSKTPPGASVDAVVAAARRSAELAGNRKLEALLVHHPTDLAGHGGDRRWRALQDLVSEGTLPRVGISASFADEPRQLAARFSPAIIQVPVSLFDQRLVCDGTLAELAARGIEIHARSIFLQGLLFATSAQLAASIRHIAPALEERRNIIRDCGATLVGGALGYALSRPELRRIVVGVSDIAEMTEIVAAADAAPADIPWADLAIEDAAVLNPSRWTAS